MFADERQQLIADLARRDGRVVVTTLAAELDVAPETVRRDLDALATQGLVRRVHGGAVPVDETSGSEAPVAQRALEHAEAKTRIARTALSLLPEGRSSIVLDAGTTTAQLAEVLPARSELLVVTNAVPIAARLGVTHPGEVHLLGGRVRGVTQATVGETGVRQLERLRTDVAFLGSDGITVEHGLSTPDQSEASVKRAMHRSARSVVALVDSSKIGRELLHCFARLDDVDVVVTDTGIDARALAALEQTGVRVMTA